MERQRKARFFKITKKQGQHIWDRIWEHKTLQWHKVFYHLFKKYAVISEACTDPPYTHRSTMLGPQNDGELCADTGRAAQRGPLRWMEVPSCAILRKFPLFRHQNIIFP